MSVRFSRQCLRNSCHSDRILIPVLIFPFFNIPNKTPLSLSLALRHIKGLIRFRWFKIPQNHALRGELLGISFPAIKRARTFLNAIEERIIIKVMPDALMYCSDVPLRVHCWRRMENYVRVNLLPPEPVANHRQPAVFCGRRNRPEIYNVGGRYGKREWVKYRCDRCRWKKTAYNFYSNQT